jgi:hypothetical protein
MAWKLHRFRWSVVRVKGKIEHTFAVAIAGEALARRGHPGHSPAARSIA